MVVELGIWYCQVAMVADELELLEEHRHGSPFSAGELGLPAKRTFVGTSLRLHEATLAHVTLAALNFEGCLTRENHENKEENGWTYIKNLFANWATNFIFEHQILGRERGI